MAIDRDARNESKRRWYAANPGKNALYVRRWRQTPAGMQYTMQAHGPLFRKLRKDWIVENPDAICSICASKDRLELDHILPVSEGGETEPANLQVLCRSCHRAKTYEERRVAAGV